LASMNVYPYTTLFRSRHIHVGCTRSPSSGGGFVFVYGQCYIVYLIAYLYLRRLVQRGILIKSSGIDQTVAEIDGNETFCHKQFGHIRKMFFSSRNKASTKIGRAHV